MSEADDRRRNVTKRVTFTEKDAEEQIATGVALVPEKVDRQGDFVREETIRDFADQFENFIEVGEADGGIMHAAWPSDWMALEESRVLDDAETVGGEDVPAGSWVQSWKVTDDDLWTLVEDDVLGSLSIGARNVRWDGPFDPEDPPEDVEVTDEHPDDQPIWEVTEGLMRETSTVDIPAVPDAHILDTKDAAGLAKALKDHVGNRDAFIEEAMERGHSEGDAERLWDLLNRALEIEGAGSPGEKSALRKAGEAFLKTLTGSDDGSDTNQSPEDPDPADTARKEGRTLNQQNEDDLKAVMDAAASVFRDAGRNPEFTRFTDREDDAFDLGEHSAREFEDDEDDENAGPFDLDAPTDDTDATGSDTPDDTTMSDTNTDDPMADAPEWAKALNDRIDDLEAETDGGGGEKTDDPLADAPEWAQKLDERVAEVEAKTADGDGEDKPEWAKDLEARVDTIVEQSGVSSDQLSGASGGDGGSDEAGLDDIAKALS